MFKRLLRILFLSGVILSGSAWAQSDAIRSEFGAALRDAQAAQVVGPIEVKLLDEALLQLPQDYTFVPVPAATRLLKAMGNAPDPHLVGVVFPGHQDNWMMAIQFEKSGHIQDDDARDWNVDDLLKSVSDSTERGDAERRRQGFPEIQVLGWAEKPRYDPATHRLVWAVAARDRAATATADQGVNYNTYALGREGYFKLNLVTDLKDLPSQKAAADAVLDSLQYVDGKKYGDFNPATDKVADFSVVALVAGIAAKKLGLFAVLGATAIEYLKSIIIAGVVVLFLLGWIIFRKAATRRSESAQDDFPPTVVSNQEAGFAPLPRADELSIMTPTVPQYFAPPAPTPAPGPAASTPSEALVPGTAERPIPVPGKAATVPQTLPPVPQGQPTTPPPRTLPQPASQAAPQPARPSATATATQANANLPASPTASAPVGTPTPAPIEPAATAPVVNAPTASPQVAPSVAAPLAAPPAAAEPVVSLGDEKAAVSGETPVELVPLLPIAPVAHVVEETDIPDVSEPEMIFTPRASGSAPLSIPSLVSEPMLIFGAPAARTAAAPAPRPAAATPAPSVAPVASPAPGEEGSTNAADPALPHARE